MIRKDKLMPIFTEIVAVALLEEELAHAEIRYRSDEIFRNKVKIICVQLIKALDAEAVLDGQQKNLHEMMDELVVDGHAHGYVELTVAHIPNSEIRKQPEKKV